MHFNMSGRLAGAHMASLYRDAAALERMVKVTLEGIDADVERCRYLLKDHRISRYDLDRVQFGIDVYARYLGSVDTQYVHKILPWKHHVSRGLRDAIEHRPTSLELDRFADDGGPTLD